MKIARLIVLSMTCNAILSVGITRGEDAPAGSTRPVATQPVDPPPEPPLAGPRDVLRDRPQGMMRSAGSRAPMFTRKRSIVFLCDITSATSEESLVRLRKQLADAISSLRAFQNFDVVICRDGEPLPYRGGKLLPANSENRQKGIAVLDDLQRPDQTDPMKAIDRTLSLRPRLVYLITDHAWTQSDAVLAEVREHNRGDREHPAAKFEIVLFTAAPDHANAATPLQELAKQNNGVFRYVNPADPEADLSTPLSDAAAKRQ